MFKYSAYGLKFNSELLLPELREINSEGINTALCMTVSAIITIFISSHSEEAAVSAASTQPQQQPQYTTKQPAYEHNSTRYNTICLISKLRKELPEAYSTRLHKILVDLSFS